MLIEEACCAKNGMKGRLLSVSRVEFSCEVPGIGEVEGFLLSVSAVLLKALSNEVRLWHAGTDNGICLGVSGAERDSFLHELCFV